MVATSGPFFGQSNVDIRELLNRVAAEFDLLQEENNRLQGLQSIPRPVDTTDGDGVEFDDMSPRSRQRTPSPRKEARDRSKTTLGSLCTVSNTPGSGPPSPISPKLRAAGSADRGAGPLSTEISTMTPGEVVDEDILEDAVVVTGSKVVRVFESDGPEEEDRKPSAEPRTFCAEESDDRRQGSNRSLGKFLSSESSDPCRLKKLVESTAFECIFGLLIFINTLVMAAEAQYRGIESAFVVGIPGSLRSAEQTWPNFEDAAFALDMFFGILFTLECSLKILGLRIEFANSGWNWFDLFIVCLWLIEKASTAALALDPMMLRLMRLARLVRLARMVRTIQAFDSLQVMIGSITASVAVLFWSSVLLMLVQMTMALFLCSMLGDFIQDEEYPIEHRHMIWSYFGTFTRAFLTMFEFTLANWITPCRYLTNYVHEGYGFFVLIYKLIGGFAVVTVITGVFLHETFKVASTDDELMVVQKRRAAQKHVSKMQKLLMEADSSCDGIIQKDEWVSVLQNPKIQTWLAAQELEVSNPDALFEYLSGGDGGISADELIAGVARLKGPARSMDMVAMMHKTQDIDTQLETILELLENQRHRPRGLS